ncbi:MAG: rod shape-determining protein MreC [Bacteroidetes bacterium]|nr:rod shape-determining protein MreC [Bacteroidota bacterium]
MRKLIAFFRRFRLFLFFAFLQIIALSLYITFLSFPRFQFLTSANAISGQLYSWEHDLTKHFNLSDENLKLQEENIALRAQLPKSLFKLNNGTIKINDSVYRQQYEYIPGEVINSTVTKRNNYFTINIGESHGVKRLMGVFSPNGVVGVIHSTSDHYSIVKSALTKDINIDVTIEPIGLFGLLKWDGRHPARGNITGISNDLKIPRGSKVLTRGGSGIFPKGLLVGTVEGAYAIEGEALWDIVITYSEEYRSIQRIYVIKNLMRNEQEEIEKKIPEDKNPR